MVVKAAERVFFIINCCSTALFWMVVKERGLLSMGFGLVLFLLLFGGVIGVFFYSLVNISKRSAMRDERLIDKNQCNKQKRNSSEFLFCFTRNKTGSTHTIAPKESSYKKGWRNMNNKIYDVLKWVAIIVQQSTQHFKQ